MVTLWVIRSAHVRGAQVAAHAEATARSITDSYGRPGGLTEVAGALAAAGQHAQAEATARSITNPDWQAQALTEVAKALAHAGEPMHARHVVAQALAGGQWTNPLQVLAMLEPSALLALAADVCGAGQVLH